jgi:hypothetical protein
MIKQTLFLMLLPFGISHAAIPTGHPLASMPENSWLEVKNSAMSAVFPATPPPGNTGPRSVMDAWNGAAFDTKRNRLIVWGGGHADYSGNELYVFDVATLKWQRITEPSTQVCGTKSGDLPCADELTGYYVDGMPRARHTYAAIQYLPAQQKFCSFGGSYTYPVGKSTLHVDCFDFTASKWQRMADGFGAGVAAIDNATGMVYSHANNGGQFLTQYNPITNQWTALGNARNATAWFNGTRMTAAIDAINRKMVAVGGNEVMVWDIDNRNSDGFTSAYNVTTRGATEMVGITGPGLEWDPLGKRLLAWHGGSALFALDTKTWNWTKLSATGTTPTAGNSNGTWGRFRYIPDYDLFIAVNRTNENVYIYRPARNDKPPEPPTPQKTIDLKVQQTLSVPHDVGSGGFLKITVNNLGPDSATKVRTTFDVPSFVDISPAQPSSCSFKLRQTTCLIDRLYANTAQQFNISFSANRSGQGTTQIIVSAHESEVDSAPTDNTAAIRWDLTLAEPTPPEIEPPETTPETDPGGTPPPEETSGSGSLDTTLLAVLSGLILFLNLVDKRANRSLLHK